MNEIIAHIPIITTLFSIFFVIEIFKHYQKRKTSYLLWWTIGVLTFGLGTFAESYHALFGWNEINLKYWYIVGALLGGFPLAQGTVYLLMNRRFANISSWVFGVIIIIGAICVTMSPIAFPEGFDGKLTGSVLEWKWVRLFSPFINLYALVFLVGGAIYSALKYKKQVNKEARYKGNIYIALGGLLPGFGGAFTRAGYVNVLFVTELLGLLLIYVGYRIIKQDKHGKTVKSISHE